VVTRIILLSVAGVLGVLARYGVQGIVQPKGHAFPYGVLAVNAVGCLAFGIVAELADTRGLIGRETRLVLVTGFLGTFTTFSAYIFDSINLARHRELAIAVANAGGQFVIGIAMCIAGLAIGARI
jgi:CrcB protein